MQEPALVRLERNMKNNDHGIIKAKISKNDGFTLLEVIMAVSILTVGLLAVASMQISAMRGNAMSMTYTESTEQVQDRFEKLINANFASITDTNGNGVAGLDNTGANADGEDEDPDSRYNVYWNVAENCAGLTDAGNCNFVPGVKTIRVIVQWQERGRNRDYTFDILRNRI